MPFKDDDRKYPGRESDGPKYTIASLHLNLDAASRGKTWELLPPGFRDAEAATRYPLPSSFEDIHQIAIIPLRRNARDGGTVYMRRIAEEYKRRIANRQTALLDIGHDKVRLERQFKRHKRVVDQSINEVRNVVADFKMEADKAIATLNDLLVIGRKGMEGQMIAHIKGEKWQNETIDSAAFRNCFRLITQAVKSLHVPAGTEEAQAREAIVAQAAEALRATQDAVELADAAAIPPAPDQDTEH